MTKDIKFRELSPAEHEQVGCYGTTLANVDTQYEQTGKRFGYGKLMWAMSILSDVQELLDGGSRPSSERMELARQWINKAKYHMSEATREEQLWLREVNRDS